MPFDVTADPTGKLRAGYNARVIAKVVQKVKTEEDAITKKRRTTEGVSVSH